MSATKPDLSDQRPRCDHGVVYPMDNCAPCLKARAEAAEAALAAAEAREALLAGTEDAELHALRAEVERLTAALERLHSWEGFMSLLNEHWPESIFPTLADDEERDTGPRIVSLLRWVERLTRERDAADERLATAQEKWVERGYVAGQHAAEAEARRLLERALEAFALTPRHGGLPAEIRAFLAGEVGK